MKSVIETIKLIISLAIAFPVCIFILIFGPLIDYYKNK